MIDWLFFLFLPVKMKLLLVCDLLRLAPIINVYSATYYGNVYLVTAGKIGVAMDTTKELFRTDEEHR